MVSQKYIIWGAGSRGDLIFNILGESSIECFIEGDRSKVGDYHKEKKIIDIEEYKNSYGEYYIIVSPVEYDDIINTLDVNGISRYFLMSQLPSEMQGYGWFDGLNRVKINAEKDADIKIYGCNLFSILIYEELIRRGYKRICFVSKGEKSENIYNDFGYKYERIYDADVLINTTPETIYDITVLNFAHHDYNDATTFDSIIFAHKTKAKDDCWLLKDAKIYYVIAP